MEIPASARWVMEKLRAAGFEARLVGGCVRDELMGHAPHDWDVCTSARPEQMQAVFAGARTVEAGLKHGTLGIVSVGEVIEATSYRVETGYSDRRHPDAVRFVSDLREDLARRDFTINAMAWDERTGLIDPFDGAGDIKRRRIRCVGVPSERFGEDALRILRALRFAARFGFSVEEETAAAIHAQRGLLRRIAAERVFAELKGIVTGPAAAPVLAAFSDVLETVIPGARPFGPEAPEELGIRLALLLRGCGAEALDALRCDRALRREVEQLLEAPAPADELALRRLALEYGGERAGQIARLHGWPAEAAERTLRTSPCRSMRELAVNGGDLCALGLSGPAIGAALRALALDVLRGECENERETLLARARSGGAEA